MSEVIDDPRQIKLWSDVAKGRADFETIFAGYRSAVDFPVSAYWRDILPGHPDAKVILSDRDPEDWYESFSQTILPLILDRASWPEESRGWFEMIEAVIIGKALGGRTDRDGILAAYRVNRSAVRKLETGGRALVFRAQDGWAPLCGFLGVDLPGEDYPRTNPRADFFAAVRAGTGANAG